LIDRGPVEYCGLIPSDLDTEVYYPSLLSPFDKWIWLSFLFTALTAATIWTIMYRKRLSRSRKSARDFLFATLGYFLGQASQMNRLNRLQYSLRSCCRN
jgi:hypothetical protein